MLPQAQRSDELDIHTDDELEILEWDDGDGWCKGRDRGGKEGYFPQSYVQPSSRSPSPPHSGQGGQQQQYLSSSSAKDTNNNCNGNGKYPSILYRVEITIVDTQLIVLLVSVHVSAHVGRERMFTIRINCVPGALLCVPTLIQHTITKMK